MTPLTLLLLLLGGPHLGTARAQDLQVRQVDLDTLQTRLDQIDEERVMAERQLEDVMVQAQDIAFEAEKAKEVWGQQCKSSRQTRAQKVACGELKQRIRKLRADYFHTVGRAARMLSDHHAEMAAMTDEAAPLALSLGVVEANLDTSTVDLSETSSAWANYLYEGVNEMDAQYRADIAAAQGQIQMLLQGANTNGPVFSGHNLAGNLAAMGATSRQLSKLWGKVGDVLDIIAMVPGGDHVDAPPPTLIGLPAAPTLVGEPSRSSSTYRKSTATRPTPAPTGRSAYED